MKPRLIYHILNSCMIAGGVGFMMNMLNISQFLMQYKIIQFLGIIFVAIMLKYLLGYIRPKVQDPLMSHSLAKRFFLISMAVLAAALLMRKYHMPYYNVLLYMDIFVQLAALGISFSARETVTERFDEDILDI